MSFEPVFENFTLNEKIGTYTEKIKVECKTNVSTEDVKKIIFLSSHPFLSNSECEDGEVKFAGKIGFFVCYETQSGEIKKHECISEYNGIIKTGVNEGRCRADVEIKQEKQDTDVSGMYLTLSAMLEASVSLKEKKELPFVTGGKGVFCDQSQLTYLKGLGERSTAYPVEEEFELPYAVTEVLSQKASGIITSCQCGVGTIIVDGEVNITQILLQSGDKKDIIKETKVVPFRAEIEYDEAMPSYVATARLSEKSIKTDLTVDEEQNKSRVTASILVNLTGEAFAPNEIYPIVDAFCLDSEVELVKQSTCFEEPKTQVCVLEKISGRTEFDELEVGSTLTFCTNEKVEIVSSTPADNGVLVTGIISFLSVFKDGEGNCFTRKTETPFETRIAIPVNDNCKFNLNACIKNIDHRILSLSSGEFFAEVYFTLSEFSNCEISLITEIKKTTQKTPCLSAISVYIPQAGEALFPLSKRLNVNPSELVLTNKDLQFPLSGEERIVIYRQK